MRNGDGDATGSNLVGRYWAWLKAKQADYTLGYSPGWVSLTVFGVLACLAAPLGLLIGLLTGDAVVGVQADMTIALFLVLPVAAWAKHLGRRERGEDKWQPR